MENVTVAEVVEALDGASWKQTAGSNSYRDHSVFVTRLGLYRFTLAYYPPIGPMVGSVRLLVMDEEGQVISTWIEDNWEMGPIRGLLDRVRIAVINEKRYAQASRQERFRDFIRRENNGCQ